MKNIEKHFREMLSQSENTNICQYIRSKRTGKKGNCTFAKDCKLCQRNNLIWLNQEIPEPVKLTKFEFDMLLTSEKDHCELGRLSNNLYFVGLKEKGYFKNVDLNMTAKEVLENCEVIE